MQIEASRKALSTIKLTCSASKDSAVASEWPKQQDRLSLSLPLSLFLTRQPPPAPQSERQPRQRELPPRLPPRLRRPPFPARKPLPRRSCRSPHPSRAPPWPPIPGYTGRRAAAVGADSNGRGREKLGGGFVLFDTARGQEKGGAVLTSAGGDAH